MTAIETHFICPTNFRGARYKAVALGTGHTITIGGDDALNSDQNHDNAVRALVDKLGWTKAPDNRYGDWYRGDGGKRGYVYVMALEYSKLNGSVTVKGK